ncbi:TIGR01777 family oxidoreductase [Mucilaginibacter sp. L3T2-6]|uniref:TIGR01777 family oxidoreductase n=1 Tax=Mucilaginibacter sp. L3T2-6 TaxID=3062491 RepID=UPI00267590D2|nr:TIGR01777 family oxidoreductase [Mucilaginibacter sp. L3T2-6]MDO3642339.1 TIGR01777 family oxidoreductase [Mucilaginibacter sp. L3T2-6]MDV6214834.1 TIGR01777 family oxidoreductase [Mucilaginibacter sp. L3T2-6]
MKYKKIVLAGGNGYLGTVFAKYYTQKAGEVVILSRHEKQADGNVRTVVWDGKTRGKWTAELVNADMVINLCGKNVNCRYTEKNKAEIFASRILPTELLGEVIHDLYEPPKLWINLASATIYRHAEDRPQDEQTGEIGTGFSVDVCKACEAAFNKYETPKTRKIALRMGIALGRSDSVFPRLLNLVKFGLGGKQGNGRQYVSWVHETDAARSTEWLMDHPEINGAVNCVAPNAVKNAGLMRIIRKMYGMPFGLPATKWLLELGSIVIGTETELILKSRWVRPARLLDSGFEFMFPEAEEAVRDILKA